MSSDLEFAARVVQEILARLNDGDRRWRVLDAHYRRGQRLGDEPPAGVDDLHDTDERPTTVLVRIAADGDIVGAHVVLVVPREQAIAATADGLQDQVLEAGHGRPVPPCPGHPHPLQALEIDGVASWVCPKDRHHHCEPILTP